MATTQSSSPSLSPQSIASRKPAPPCATNLVEQQLRLSVGSPQLLAAIEILLPLAKAQYRSLSAPRSSSCDPRVAEMMKSEAEAWGMGITLAENALESIRPYGLLLSRYFHHLEEILLANQGVQR